MNALSPWFHWSGQSSCRHESSETNAFIGLIHTTLCRPLLNSSRISYLHIWGWRNVPNIRLCMRAYILWRYSELIGIFGPNDAHSGYKERQAETHMKRLKRFCFFMLPEDWLHQSNKVTTVWKNPIQEHILLQGSYTLTTKIVTPIEFGLILN